MIAESEYEDDESAECDDIWLTKNFKKCLERGLDFTEPAQSARGFFSYFDERAWSTHNQENKRHGRTNQLEVRI